MSICTFYFFFIFIKLVMMSNEHFEPFFYYDEINKIYYFVYEVGSCHFLGKSIKVINRLCEKQSSVHKCIHAMLKNNYQSSQPPGPLLIMRYFNVDKNSSEKIIGHIEKIIFTPVDVEIKLKTVERESFAKSFTYQFNIDLSYSWTDNRLCTPFKENWKIDINLDMEAHFFKTVWYPRLFFNESAGHLSKSLLETVNRLTIENNIKLYNDSAFSFNKTGYFLRKWENKLYIVRSPQVTMYQHVRLDVSCDPNAKFFPFESFTCDIELLSQEEQACVKWVKNPKFESDFKLYGFEASVSQVTIYRREAYHNLTLSAIKFTIKFKRTIGMAWRIWSLSFVSLSISFGSFSITQVIKPIASFSHLLFGVVSTLLIYLKYSQVESNYFFSPFTYWFIAIVLFLISSLALFTVSQTTPNLLPKKYTHDVTRRVTRELLRNETQKSIFELTRSIIMIAFLVIFFMSSSFLFFQSEFILDIDFFKTSFNKSINNITKKIKDKTESTNHCFISHTHLINKQPIIYLRHSPSYVNEDKLLKSFIIKNLQFISKSIQKVELTHFQSFEQNCKSLEESLKDVIWHGLNNLLCVQKEEAWIDFTPVTRIKEKNVTVNVSFKEITTTSKLTTPMTEKKTIVVTTEKVTTSKNIEYFTSIPTTTRKIVFPLTMKLPEPLNFFRQELLDIRQRLRDISLFKESLENYFLLQSNLTL